MNSNNIDPKRNAALRRKYQMDAPPQASNPVVGRVLATERLHNNLFVRDVSEYWDATRSPQMYAVAQEALRELHARMGEPPEFDDDEGHVVFGLVPKKHSPVRAHHQDNPDDAFAALNPDDPATFVHFVGDDIVHVIRGPKPVGAFDRATVGAGQPRRGDGYFTGMFQTMMEMHDEFWDRPCNVGLTAPCDGPTQLMPYWAGSVLLIFEVCGDCLRYAEASMAVGRDVSEMEARFRQGLPFD